MGLVGRAGGWDTRWKSRMVCWRMARSSLSFAMRWLAVISLFMNAWARSCILGSLSRASLISGGGSPIAAAAWLTVSISLFNFANFGLAVSAVAFVFAVSKMVANSSSLVSSFSPAALKDSLEPAAGAADSCASEVAVGGRQQRSA